MTSVFSAKSMYDAENHAFDVIRTNAKSTACSSAVDEKEAGIVKTQ